MSLNNEPCMIRSTLIDISPVELRYYPFIINIIIHLSLDKCGESCNAGNDLPTKIYDTSKTKDIDVKVFNMIANRN